MTVLKKLKSFNTCLLPELIGHWYTQQKIMVDNTQPTQQFDTSNDFYCYCHGPEEYQLPSGITFNFIWNHWIERTIWIVSSHHLAFALAVHLVNDITFYHYNNITLCTYIQFADLKLYIYDSTCYKHLLNQNAPQSHIDC